MLGKSMSRYTLQLYMFVAICTNFFSCISLDKADMEDVCVQMAKPMKKAVRKTVEEAVFLVRWHKIFLLYYVLHHLIWSLLTTERVREVAYSAYEGAFQRASGLSLIDGAPAAPSENPDERWRPCQCWRVGWSATLLQCRRMLRWRCCYRDGWRLMRQVQMSGKSFLHAYCLIVIETLTHSLPMAHTVQLYFRWKKRSKHSYWASHHNYNATSRRVCFYTGKP